MELHYDIDLPSYVINIINTLNNANFSAYAIGGAIRDSLLGIKPKDWDVATNATPDEIKSLFANTYPSGERYGTITVAYVDEQVGEEYLVEVTTFRYDQEYSDGRRPDKVIFGQTLQDDVIRRDFTINTIAFHPDLGLIDLCDGIKDLNNGVIRCVGDPDIRFKEDALRMLRAIRFAYRLFFKISEDTLESINKNKNLVLQNVSKERIRNELISILKCIKTPGSYNMVDSRIISFLFDIFQINYDYERGNKFIKQVYDMHYKKSCDNYYLVILFNIFLFGDKSPFEAESWMRLYKFTNKEIKYILNLYEAYGVFNNIDSFKDYNHLVRYLLYKIDYEIIDSLGWFLNENYNSINYDMLKLALNNNKDFNYKLDIDIDWIKQNYSLRDKKLGTCLKYLTEQIIMNPEINKQDKLVELIDLYIKNNN